MKTATTERSTSNHHVVPRSQWAVERMRLLAREKELTHLRDQVASERRALPWQHIQKRYIFDTLDGPRSLADLFAGRNQLLVQHFMFAP